MPIYTLPELRARSGAQYRDLSDEEFLRKYSEFRGVPYEDLADRYGVKPRGTLSQIGTGLMRGFSVELPRMFGQVLQRNVDPDRNADWFAVERGVTDMLPEARQQAERDQQDAERQRVRQLGQSIEYSAREREAQYLPPDLRDKNWLQGAVIKGAGGIGPAVTTVGLGVLSPRLGAMGAYELFGKSSAQETKRQLLEEGVSPADAEAAAQQVERIQGGGEAAMNFLGARALSPLASRLGLGATTTARTAAQMADTSIVKPFAKAYLTNLVGESITEPVQDVGTALVEEAYGGKQQDKWQIAKDSAQAAFGMALLLGPASFGSHVARSKQAADIKAALADDPNVPPERRAAILQQVASVARAGGVGAADIDAWVQSQIDMADRQNDSLAQMEESFRQNRQQDFEAAFNAPSGQRGVVPGPDGKGEERELTMGELIQLDAEKNIGEDKIDLLEKQVKTASEFMAKLRAQANDPESPSVWRFPVSTGLQGSQRGMFAAGPTNLLEPGRGVDVGIENTPGLEPNQILAARGPVDAAQPRPAVGTLSETQAMMAAGPQGLTSAQLPVEQGSLDGASAVVPPAAPVAPGAFSSNLFAPAPSGEAGQMSELRKQEDWAKFRIAQAQQRMDAAARTGNQAVVAGARNEIAGFSELLARVQNQIAQMSAVAAPVAPASMAVPAAPKTTRRKKAVPPAAGAAPSAAPSTATTPTKGLATDLSDELEAVDEAADKALAAKVRKDVENEDLGADVQSDKSIKFAGKLSSWMSQKMLSGIRTALLKKDGKVSKALGPRGQRIVDAARSFADAYNDYMNAATNVVRLTKRINDQDAEQAAKDQERIDALTEQLPKLANKVSNALLELGQSVDNNAKNVEAIVRFVKDSVQKKLVKPGRADGKALGAMKSMDAMLSSAWNAAKRGVFMGEEVDLADISGAEVRQSAEQQEAGNAVTALEKAYTDGYKAPKGGTDLYTGLQGMLQYLSFNTTPQGKMLAIALQEALDQSSNAPTVVFSDTERSRYEPKTNTIYINRGEQTAEVILHETLHAGLQWFVYQNPKHPAVTSLRASLKRALAVEGLTGRALDVQNILRDLVGEKRGLDAVLEMVSYNATLNEFRKAMQQVPSSGKTAAFRTSLNNIWSNLKRLVSQAFGLKPSLASDIMDASMQLLEESSKGALPEKMKGKPLDVKVKSGQAKQGVAAATTQQSRSKVEQTIAKMPPYARGPARTIATALGDVSGRALDKIMFTSSLIKRATDLGINSAKAFERALQARDFAAREEERTIERILDLYTKVPEAERGRGEGSVNRFLFDSTREGKWGYDAGIGKVDPEMAKRFSELSDESQEFVRAVFSHGTQMLLRKRDIVLNATASEYDLQIAVAKTDEEKAELQAAKRAALTRYKSLFDIRKGKPYAPIKRTGNYVVVGKSDEYADAEQNKDTKLLKKLQNDPDHYHVSFTDGKAAAKDLREQLREQGVFKDPQVGQRDTIVDELFSNEDALQQLAKLRSNVNERAKAGDEAAPKLLDAINRMYLEALAETSARKSEMKRRGVDGEVDMIGSFGTQGRADANFLASLQYGEQIRDLMAAMRNESRTGDRTRKSEVFNELMRRYIQSMEVPETPWLNKLTRMSSLYFLTTSPAYYLQNLTQPFMMSVPAMTGEFSYAKVNKELFGAYTELGPIMKSAKLFSQQLDYSKVPDDVRAAIDELVSRGRIDIGLETEIGEFKVDGEGRLGKEWNRVDKGMRMLVQKGEAVNRLSTAIAAYRLAMSKPNATPEKAIDYADRILVETHGDYSRSNAPRPFNTALGKVTLQFRKFQLIQLSWYASMIKQAYAGNPVQRKAALRSLGFALSHTAILTGAIGTPGYAAISWVLGQLFGDDDEEFDLTDKIRKMIGDEDIANLVLRGAPTLVGADLSGKIGAGNMLSIMPFSNADLTTKSGFYEALGTIAGGAAAGMVARGIDGLGLLANGDYMKGMELLLPKGLGDMLKGYRMATEGVTRRNADVLIPADEVSALDATLQGVGVQPAKMSVMYERQDRVKAIKDKLDARTSEIKQKYVKAIRARDSEAAAEARTEWRKLQDAKKKAGLKRGSMSDLYKAPREQKKREKRTREGLQYTPATEGLVQDVTER